MGHEIPQQIEHKIRYENLWSIKLNILPLFLLIFFLFLEMHFHKKRILFMEIWNGVVII